MLWSWTFVSVVRVKRFSSVFTMMCEGGNNVLCEVGNRRILANLFSYDALFFLHFLLPFYIPLVFSPLSSLLLTLSFSAILSQTNLLESLSYSFSPLILSTWKWQTINFIRFWNLLQTNPNIWWFCFSKISKLQF